MTPSEARMYEAEKIAEKWEQHQKLRPTLNIENAPQYLDWLTQGLHLLSPEHVAHHLTAAELVVRLRMGDAQAKATQHTLVEDGVIAPPPSASPSA